MIDNSVPSYEQVNEEKSFVRNLGKYFLHGFFYSIVMTFSTVILGFVVVFLIVIGSLIGLVVGFCAIFITMGLVNKELSAFFWEIDAYGGWHSILGHGFILFLAFLILSIPGMFIGIVFLFAGDYSYIVYNIASILVYSLVDGYVGKRVATFFDDSGLSNWSKQGAREQTRHAGPSRHSKCPICGSLFPYRMSEVSYDRKATCRHCGTVLQLPPE